MKYIFLLNRFSLKDKLEEVKYLIGNVAKDEKLDYKIEINNKEISTEDIVKSYKGKKVILCAIGGDGIINRVLNAMDLDNNILSFIPYGTGNDFYKSCDLQFKDGMNSCDLVKINDKYFINTACFGIDADIANNSDIIHSKWIPKSQRYNASLFVNFLKYKNRHLVVKINDEVMEDDYTTIAVCNGMYYGGGYRIGYHSKLNDFAIDVYLVPRLSKIKMALLILGMNKGKHEKSKNVLKYRVKHLSIKSEKEFTCNIDGEELADNQFDMEVVGKIDILYSKNLINSVKGMK